jgi:hypothetical protein
MKSEITSSGNPGEAFERIALNVPNKLREAQQANAEILSQALQRINESIKDRDPHEWYKEHYSAYGDTGQIPVDEESMRRAIQETEKERNARLIKALKEAING